MGLRDDFRVSPWLFYAFPCVETNGISVLRLTNSDSYEIA